MSFLQRSTTYGTTPLLPKSAPKAEKKSTSDSLQTFKKLKADFLNTPGGVKPQVRLEFVKQLKALNTETKNGILAAEDETAPIKLQIRDEIIDQTKSILEELGQAPEADQLSVSDIVETLSIHMDFLRKNSQLYVRDDAARHIQTVGKLIKPIIQKLNHENRVELYKGLKDTPSKEDSSNLPVINRMIRLGVLSLSIDATPLNDKEALAQLETLATQEITEFKDTPEKTDHMHIRRTGPALVLLTTVFSKLAEKGQKPDENIHVLRDLIKSEAKEIIAQRTKMRALHALKIATVILTPTPSFVDWTTVRKSEQPLLETFGAAKATTGKGALQKCDQLLEKISPTSLA